VTHAEYGTWGPVEQLTMDEIRRQFETNLFGAVRVSAYNAPAPRRPAVGGSRR
jgi:NAD(P)-dependent dehydrogenase (short-subunit alcohol dehydrogenase family)